jgi:hypothetical protein
MMDVEDARCPECLCPASRTLGLGNWLFRCAPCQREWGHPQQQGSAAEALYDLRRKQWPIAQQETGHE